MKESKINKSSLPSALKHMKTVQEVHEYYQKIISCMPNNVYWLDKNCITQGCNENVLKFVGLKSLDEFIGIDYEQMEKIAGWPKGHAKIYKKDDIKVISSGKPMLNIEDPPVYDANGEPIYYLSSRVPIFDEKTKEVIGVVGISVDITELKKIEEALLVAKKAAEVANQAKSEFLDNMRHDIRTPLSGIVGFSEILESEAKDPQTKDYAQTLKASACALNDFMDEVLEAVRVNSGEIPRLKQKFNLFKTFEQIINLCRAKAKEKHLNLDFKLDPKLPRFVIGDKIRLQRIGLELISNALNFTDQGKVSLGLQLAKESDGQLILRMVVEDTGMGIPQDKQQDIYLQFKRLTPSYQGIYKGAGLGLYVVKQFIDDLGGEIYVNSEPRKGSCFNCLIPLQIPLLDDESDVRENDLLIDKPYMKSLTITEKFAEKAENSPNKDQILVVEDSKIAQMAAKAILSQMDCEVDIAIDGKEAIELTKKKDYKLIFMDIGLGEGMDGYEVTFHIRKSEDFDKRTPIIALTAHAGDENKQRCIKAGMDAVLTKPLNIIHAKDLLANFIPSRRPQPSKNPRLDLPDTDEEMFQLDQFALLDERQL